MLKDTSLINSSARLTKTLLTCIFLIFTFHIINILLGKPSYNFDRLVHLDHEGNLPTWFSSALWAIGAMVAYSCSILAEVKFEKRMWFTFGLLLLILSIDEVAMLHEHVFGMMIGKVIRQFTGSAPWLKWPVIASPVILFWAFPSALSSLISLVQKIYT